MDLAFPCAGNLDDGIFDLGLEGDCDGVIDGWNRRTASACDTLAVSSNSESMLPSPDALDMALMAFKAGTSGDDASGASDSRQDTRSSPFCDASIRQQDSRSFRTVLGSKKCNATSPFDGESSAPHPVIEPIQLSHTLQKKHSADCASPGARRGSSGTNTNGDDLSVRARLMHWHPAKVKRGGVAQALPPRLARDCDGPPISDECLSPEHRGQEISCRLPGQLLDRSIADTNAQSRWALERAGTREMIASSLRREEKALAVADQATVSSVDKTLGAKIGVASVRGKRVSFAIDVAGSRDSPSPGTSHVVEDEWDETSDIGADGEEEQEDDLLARASELHSSVAGQLRSVNELLRRKSYFYIDTSWSAKQLPCPPTAWKGKGVGGAATDGHALGTDVETSPDSGTASAAAQYRPVALPGINVVLKLEGRWISAGSKKSRVGFHSVPGDKVHDLFWKCQDAGIVIAPFDRRGRQALFAVFDGHGTNGRQASHQCMERLPKYLKSASRSGNPASALRRSCQWLHRDLATGVAGDCTRSGTTLCAAVLTGRRLTVANVGDSGCLRLSRPAGNFPGGEAADNGVDGVSVATDGRRRRGNVHVDTQDRRLVVERLSRDHKPGCKDELERIQGAGGIVFPLPGRYAAGNASGSGMGIASPGSTCVESPGNWEGTTTVRDFEAEVPRVWKAGGGGPGLAMSRSIGDKAAHSIGVTHEPEITECDLDPRVDVMLVLASDGVWDVLSAEDIRKVAESHVVDDAWCPQALSVEICRKAVSGWATATRGGSDDITCLVVKTVGIFPTRRSSPSSAETEKGIA